MPRRPRSQRRIWPKLPISSSPSVLRCFPSRSWLSRYRIRSRFVRHGSPGGSRNRRAVHSPTVYPLQCRMNFVPVAIKPASNTAKTVMYRSATEAFAVAVAPMRPMACTGGHFGQITASLRVPSPAKASDPVTTAAGLKHSLFQISRHGYWVPTFAAHTSGTIDARFAIILLTILQIIVIVDFAIFDFEHAPEFISPMLSRKETHERPRKQICHRQITPLSSRLAGVTVAIGENDQTVSRF